MKLIAAFRLALPMGRGSGCSLLRCRGFFSLFYSLSVLFFSFFFRLFIWCLYSLLVMFFLLLSVRLFFYYCLYGYYCFHNFYSCYDSFFILFYHHCYYNLFFFLFFSVFCYIAEDREKGRDKLRKIKSYKKRERNELSFLPLK